MQVEQNSMDTLSEFGLTGIGLLWIVTFYVLNGQVASYPSFLQWYDDLGNWNIFIGMGFIVASFGFAMKWE